jgi:hypothetical protein
MISFPRTWYIKFLFSNDQIFGLNFHEEEGNRDLSFFSLKHLYGFVGF